MFSLEKTEINRKEEYAMKKILALLMAAMMLLGMCSFASAEDEKIHIIFQYSFEEQMRAPILAVIDQFMKDNPDIVVECVYGGSYSESNTERLSRCAADGSVLRVHLRRKWRDRLHGRSDCRQQLPH